MGGDPSASRDPRALHLFDCAGVGHTLVTEARRQHLPWRYLPLRDTSADRVGGVGSLVRRARAGTWEARRLLRTLSAELIHIHYGARVGILKKAPRRPFVVHLHGTDIRTQYHDPRFRDLIQWGADNAQAVVYSTPDLRSHALQARADARYLPNPVDLTTLPSWRPTARPRIVFASRWDGSKGLEGQLGLAEALGRAVPDVDIVGLEWGQGAPQAAAAGVRLVPTMPPADYLQLLAGAHVVVGQSSGVLGISELQAVGIGVPTVMPVNDEWHTDDPPVLMGTTAEMVELARAALEDPRAASQRLDGPGWIRRTRSPAEAVATLRAIYRAAV